MDGDVEAVKGASRIEAVMAEYLGPLEPRGRKLLARCPFHDDAHPSLQVDPERQSFKCWPCGEGGDVLDFIQKYERVDFVQALELLAHRAGLTVTRQERPADAGPSKVDLQAVMGWAAGLFAAELGRAPAVQAYLAGRGLAADLVAGFGLGYCPLEPGWLERVGRQQGYAPERLEGAGLMARSDSGRWYCRFRGRLLFPICNLQGRPIAFSGRVLPEVEAQARAQGRPVGKYVNSPETTLFKKREVLYGADRARAGARQRGWVAVVEGQTDVMLCHQHGLTNAVATLGTALTAEHVATLRRLAGRAVLIFDGDEAGQKAAERALGLFMGHPIDLRILILPAGTDPADFLARRGEAAFLELVERALDPLEFAVGRALDRNVPTAEGHRRASEEVLGLLARLPGRSLVGMDLKVAAALSKLAGRTGIEARKLGASLQQMRRTARAEPWPEAPPAPRAWRLEDLDPLEAAAVRLILAHPETVGELATRLIPAACRDAPLRAILAACYAAHAEGRPPAFSEVGRRLGDAERSLAAGLLQPVDAVLAPGPEVPAARQLREITYRLDLRAWEQSRRELREAREEARGEEREALSRELLRGLAARPRPPES
jgi:DNA primase